MADDDLRGLERVWVASRSGLDERRLVAARLRAGVVSRGALRLAVLHDSRVAADVLGLPFEPRRAKLASWYAPRGKLGAERADDPELQGLFWPALLRGALAAIRAAFPGELAAPGDEDERWAGDLLRDVTRFVLSQGRESGLAVWQTYRRPPEHPAAWSRASVAVGLVAVPVINVVGATHGLQGQGVFVRTAYEDCWGTGSLRLCVERCADRMRGVVRHPAVHCREVIGRSVGDWLLGHPDPLAG